mgnify:CR=1 FL=1
MPLYSWGSNAGGHFGTDVGSDYYYPEMMAVEADFETLVAGGEHAIGLTTTGELFGCGKSSHGQLGRHGDILSFERLDIAGVRQVATGFRHSLALAESGSVFVCGDNSKGQLGLGLDVKERLEWTLLNLEEPVAFICCGVFFSVAVACSGRVFVWGMNRRKVLDDQDQSIIWHPVIKLYSEPIAKASAGHHHLLALSASGKLFCSGDFGSLHGTLNVADILSGWKTVLVRYMGDAESLHLHGSNDLGQLCCTDSHAKGHLITVRGLKSVAMGGEHGLILTNDALLAWGWNEHGCLGQGHNMPIKLNYPIKINFPVEDIIGVYAGYGASYLRTRSLQQGH